jgi:hypothetical protein
VRDILHYDRRVPSCAHDRLCDVAELATARREARTRIAWPVIFLKAYARMAATHPVLRQVYMSWPWPHLYEHHQNVATLVIQRRFEGDDWLFWGQFPRPETRSLTELQEHLDWYQQAPISEAYRRQLWLARRSTPLRRMAWWVLVNVTGKKRCQRLGTYFLSTISGLGAEIQKPPSMLTSGFTYGPLDTHGRCRLTMVYDHRLMDGHYVARMLRDVEEALRTDLLAELIALRRLSAAA